MNPLQLCLQIKFQSLWNQSHFKFKKYKVKYIIWAGLFHQISNSPHTPKTNRASMPSKSSLEEPVARNITSQVGNCTLMHSWRLPCSCFSSCMISAGMETCRAGAQQSSHLFTAIQAHMARLTTFSSSAPAGAMHTPIQPVIKMSLGDSFSPSAGHSFAFPL